MTLHTSSRKACMALLVLVIAAVPLAGMDTLLGDWPLVDFSNLAGISQKSIAARGGTPHKYFKDSALELDGLVYYYNYIVNREKTDVCTSIALIPDRHQWSTKTAAQKQAYEKELVPLPERFVKAGLSWGSSYRQWMDALGKQDDLLLELKEPAGTYIQYGRSTSGLTVYLQPDYRARVGFTWSGNHALSIQLYFESGEKGWDPDAPYTLDSLGVSITPGARFSSGPFTPAAKEEVVLATEQRFALGLSGILIKGNYGRHETLTVFNGNETKIDSTVRMLARDWGIKSGKDLVETCNKLMAGMHANTWNDMRRMLQENPDAKIEDLILDRKLSIAEGGRLFLVKHLGEKLGPLGIEAWDLGRAVALARWACDAGFVTPDESWEIIGKIWQRVRTQYGSWDDWAFHYIAGRAFWSSGDKDYLKNINAALLDFYQLRSDESSIYHQPWTNFDPGRGKGLSLADFSLPSTSPFLLWYDLWLALEQIGKQEKYDSMKKIAYAPNKYPAVFEPWLQLLLEQGKADEAEAEVKRALAYWPDNLAMLCRAGDIFRRTNALGEAAAAFGKAVELSPGNREALGGMGIVALMQGDGPKAAKLFDQAAREFKTTPDIQASPQFWLDYCQALMAAGRSAEIERILEELTQAYPRWAPPHYLLGVALLNPADPRPDLALGEFRKAQQAGMALPDQVRKWMEEQEAQASPSL